MKQKRKPKKEVLKTCSYCLNNFLGKTTAKYCCTKCLLLCNTKIMDTGCWEWQNYCQPGGYGRVKLLNQKTVLVHRKMYEIIKNVELPVKTLVCHRCDNRKCLNPEHLFIGTHLDNALDCISKGRRIYAQGEENCKSKLNWHMIDEIRKLRKQGWTIMALGKKFGVYHSNISRICLNKTWRKSP